MKEDWLFKAILVLGGFGLGTLTAIVASGVEAQGVQGYVVLAIQGLNSLGLLALGLSLYPVRKIRGEQANTLDRAESFQAPVATRIPSAWEAPRPSQEADAVRRPEPSRVTKREDRQPPGRSPGDRSWDENLARQEYVPPDFETESRAPSDVRETGPALHVSDQSQATRVGERSADGSERESQPSRSREDDLSPGRLIQVWESYLHNGDGRFKPEGFRRELEKAGIQAHVEPGLEIGFNDSLIGVSASDRAKVVYLLPNFTRSVQSVAAWYPDADTYARGAAISRVTELAVGQRVGGRVELQKQGRLG